MVPYKIAVYTICKNEVTNVDKWINSMMEADYLCVLDTGSTDGTWERLVEWREKYPYGQRRECGSRKNIRIRLFCLVLRSNHGDSMWQETPI